MAESVQGIVEPYASPDECHVAQGVRLTDGAGKLDALLASATRPVSMKDMETALRPELDRQEHGAPDDWGCLVVGMARFYPWGDRSYTLVAPGRGMLAGRWLGWEDALCAYGYFLGGETSGSLEELVGHVSRDPKWGHYVTLTELQKFVEAAR